jgi:serine/threonine protein phosphatase PrpC/predicted Ser/Thr protein kinase
MPSQPKISIAQSSIAGNKTSNDDSYGIMVPEGQLLATKGIAMAIADGMSSSEAAKEASETCVKSFLTDYYDTPDSWTVQTAVGRVLSATNRWLNGQAVARFGSDTGMASTFSGLILKAGQAHIFHIGDSQIARIRGDRHEVLTRPHRNKSRDGDFLARAVGADLHLDIDYRAVPVEKGDIFAFTTDGVHEFLDETYINELLKSGIALEKISEDIINTAITNGSHDNVTCQLVRIDDVGSRDKKALYQSLAELPFPPDLEPGQKIGGYRIVRELHASPRSQVYVAIEESSGKKVALKTPSQNYNDDPMYLEFFAREEWIGQSIQSAHVASTLLPVEPRQFLYIVLEYIEGQSLGQWMSDNPRPSLVEVRRIAEQIIKGLRSFHRKEIIHQDLKPDNIMLDTEGTVKIVDFGSVRVLGIEEAEVGHIAEHAMGTAAYSAPELIVGAKATKQSDLYSIAAIVYEMLTGKLPYGKALSSKRIIDRTRYQPAYTYNPEVPVWLDGALETALSKDASQRQPVLSEFLSDIMIAKEKYKKDAGPLIKRNPVKFWQGLSAILAVLLLLSLYV